MTIDTMSIGKDTCFYFVYLEDGQKYVSSIYNTKGEIVYKKNNEQINPNGYKLTFKIGTAVGDPTNFIFYLEV